METEILTMGWWRDANRDVEYNARITETPDHPAQGREWSEVQSNKRGTHGLYEQEGKEFTERTGCKRVWD